MRATWEPHEEERERRIRSIMFLWLASQRDAMLHGLLTMLLQAPTWDPEAVAMWVALMQTGEKERVFQRLSEVMQRQSPPPLIIPAKCPVCAANLNEHIDLSNFQKGSPVVNPTQDDVQAALNHARGFEEDRDRLQRELSVETKPENVR